MKFLTRFSIAIATVASTGSCLFLYARILDGAEGGFLEPVAMLLLGILIAWLSFSFWIATVGLFRSVGKRLARRDVPAERPFDGDFEACSTAILVPIYNECPASVFARVKTMAEEIASLSAIPRFDFFVLSDSTNPDTWLQEERAWSRLRGELPPTVSLYYRHQPQNTSRKAGNIADFCEKWGKRYDYMVILEADSLMTAETIVEMVRRMDADRTIGILQVPPRLVDRESFFARLQQVAGSAYSATFLEGYTAWVGDEGNYWGHNAILRMAPFKECCALPTLPGSAPLGGEILSHDFVEAALLQRAGWKTVVASDLAGSYEECPPTLIDFAQRDQRWCQGNLQHVRLLLSEGFAGMSRFHFASGALSYLASPLWPAFIVVHLLVMARSGEDAALVSNTWATLGLVGVTLGLLFLPKLWALLAFAAAPQQVRGFGGWLRLTTSVVLEIVVSTLTAPILAVYHTLFVGAAFLGKAVRWDAQQREERGTTPAEAARTFWPHTLLGLASGLAVWFVAPAVAPWFLPIAAGLTFAIPLAGLLGSRRVGNWLRRRGLFLIPEEVDPPTLLQRYHVHERSFETKPLVRPGEDLFVTTMTDPGMYAVHLHILRSTHCDRPAAPDTRRAVEQARRDGSLGSLDARLRREILSDREAFERLHLEHATQQECDGQLRPQFGEFPVVQVTIPE